MSLKITDQAVAFSPGPFDVHAHPRVLDVITDDEFLPPPYFREGKAGLGIYTEVALRSGIVGMLAMPNEALRLWLPGSVEQTELLQFPIATADRLAIMLKATSSEANIPTGQIFGLDPAEAIRGLQNKQVNRPHLYKEFTAVKDDCLALKIYGAETTGGNNIDKRFIPEIAELWHGVSPEKPVIMHLEDGDVAEVLQAVAKRPKGKEISIHIAHVSSRQELEAVIEAKKAGMNVTCEVTPHHLTFDESLTNEIGSFGCMKPSLKTKEDVEFIWENIDQVDIFASDCAPHRQYDKDDTSKVTYGVTNHTVMLPTLMQAVEDGKITYEDIYQKFCVTPRERFNMPANDGSYVQISREQSTAYKLEEAGQFAYGENPWLKTKKDISLFGKVTVAIAGKSKYEAFSNGEESASIQTSYTHLLRPKTWKE